jgi:hypothetical protein
MSAQLLACLLSLSWLGIATAMARLIVKILSFFSTICLEMVSNLAVGKEEYSNVEAITEHFWRFSSISPLTCGVKLPETLRAFGF